jgi:phytanoyl-CoA hydroxylase
MTPTLAADFQRDGFVVVPRLLTPAEVQSAIEHLDRSRRSLRLPDDAPMVAVPPTDLALSGPVPAVAALLLDGPVETFGMSYLCKPAGSGLPALWHQDGFPWRERLGDAAALTIWVALDDTDSTNGCLRMIPGSHKLPAQPLRQVESPLNMFGVELDPDLVEDARGIDLPLSAGDASAHHPGLVHSSKPNRSTRPRRALAIRYRRVTTTR